MSNRRTTRSRTASESSGLGQCSTCHRQDSNESLITCNLCANQFHPKCLRIQPRVVNRQFKAHWNCSKCKSCEICGRKTRVLRSIPENNMLQCKGCDRGFHKNCVQFDEDNDEEDEWYCVKCEKKYGSNTSEMASPVQSQDRDVDEPDEDEEAEEVEDEDEENDEEDEVDEEDEDVEVDVDADVDMDVDVDIEEEGEEEEEEEDDDDNEDDDDEDEEEEEEQEEVEVEEEGEGEGEGEEEEEEEEEEVEEEVEGENQDEDESASVSVSVSASASASSEDENEDEQEDDNDDEIERPQPRLTRQRSKAAAEKSNSIPRPRGESFTNHIHDLNTPNSASPLKKQRRENKNSQSRGRGRKRKLTKDDTKPLLLVPKKPKIDDEDNHEEEEGIRCRVPDCDSKGHLSGKHKEHYLTSTCPIFHNMTTNDCEQLYQKRVKRREANETANKITTRKSPHKEEKLINLMEQRKKEMNQIISSPNSRKNNFGPRAIASREPDLKALTPIFDHEMFREAQSRAAELVQEQIKENPPKKSGIKTIEMGKYEMDVWYSSPYPPEYSCLPKLYICEFCLKYFNSSLTMKRHISKCPLYCPPGNEIYRKGNISVFEIDGEKNKLYCQNLCLLAKLFLDHKTLYYDVEPFRFYIMTESDNDGFHIIGYFSKEKNSFLNYNVSCILTLPPYQKQGYGRMLIDFSYLLTKVECKVGSPEKPLSDLGLISYRSYWKSVIMEYLCNYQGNEISIKDLSIETAINAYDIVSTLQALGMLKYWKGKHLVLTKKDILDEYRMKTRRKKNLKAIDPSCLRWEKPEANETSK